jgi:hypothetical protein
MCRSVLFLQSSQWTATAGVVGKSAAVKLLRSLQCSDNNDPLSKILRKNSAKSANMPTVRRSLPNYWDGVRGRNAHVIEIFALAEPVSFVVKPCRRLARLLLNRRLR